MPFERADLDAYLGKNISEICRNGFHTHSLNHCAHFVSHVTNMSFGYTCASQTKDKEGQKLVGACIRVQEIFPRCKKGGNFMCNVHKKHIGIYIGHTIWHYSNTKNKVIKQLDTQFANHYPGRGYAMYFGKPPACVETAYASKIAAAASSAGVIGTMASISAVLTQ